MVVALDPYRLTEMFETLAGLESLCAELAARRMTKAELQRLEEIHLSIGTAASAGRASATKRMVQKMNRMLLSHEEHGTVLEALRTGSAVEAGEKMRHHVLGAENITDMILSVRR